MLRFRHRGRLAPAALVALAWVVQGCSDKAAAESAPADGGALDEGGVPGVNGNGPIQSFCPCTTQGGPACQGGAQSVSCPHGCYPTPPSSICTGQFEPMSDGPVGFCCIPSIGDCQDVGVSPCGFPAYSVSCPPGGPDLTTYEPSLACALAKSVNSDLSGYCCEPVPSACSANPGLACPVFGLSCSAGTTPEAVMPGVACGSLATDTSGNADYCCFQWLPAPQATCVPDQGLALCDSSTPFYGFQCEGTEDPTATSSDLTCSDGQPDADGIHTDYCCTFR
jgi:hypothetical protein